MDAKKLVELRRQAEKAVADMSDGELKVKAFEVMLAHLMGGLEVTPGRLTETQNEPKAKARKEGTPARSIGGRILVLQDEGFFKNQKTIGEVREELRAHGWHYPLTTLSGRLQALVQQRKLEEKEPSRATKRSGNTQTPEHNSCAPHRQTTSSPGSKNSRRSCGLRRKTGTV
jgi:hypothetical protein